MRGSEHAHATRKAWVGVGAEFFREEARGVGVCGDEGAWRVRYAGGDRMLHGASCYGGKLKLVYEYIGAQE